MRACVCVCVSLKEVSYVCEGYLYDQKCCKIGSIVNIITIKN